MTFKPSKRILLFAALAAAAIGVSVIRFGAVPYPTREKKWSIGIYTGQAPFDLHAFHGLPNPVLSARDVTDVPAKFVADPFMIRRDATWYMFFEVLDARSRRGKIGVATSSDALQWRYGGIVLAEPFHLSYPYVFAVADAYYMIPESGEARSIRLYRAEGFPTRWVFIGSLVSGQAFADSSIVQYGGRWFIFTETSPYVNDTLALYHADTLEGPWREHPRSPIVTNNPHISRPGGRVLLFDGKLYRYTQDDAPTYGTQVFAFEITELTATGYHERPVGELPILKPGDGGWNGKGMHHVDPHPVDAHTWIACVDGAQRSWGLGFYYWR